MEPAYLFRQQRTSTLLFDLLETSKRLQEFWNYRWILFVNNSPKGPDCVFAAGARRKSATQHKELLALLSDIENQARIAREAVEASHRDLMEELDAEA